MEKGVLFILSVNLLGTLLVGRDRVHKRQSLAILLFFIFLPILGFLIYFIPHKVKEWMGIENYDRESLVKRFEIGKSAEHPDIERELNVVPIEDAMAISQNTEKRSLLLNQLKKDIHSNYKEIMAAKNDKDSESAHYVAAAKMEVYRVQQKKWTKTLNEYEENPKSPTNYTVVIKALKDFINSDLMSAKEQEMYKRKYCELIKNQSSVQETLITDEDYTVYLSYLIDLKCYDEADKFWNKHKRHVENETAYMKMMEMFFDIKSEDKFNNCVKELQENATIRLSANGLEALRYWLKKE